MAANIPRCKEESSSFCIEICSEVDETALRDKDNCEFTEHSSSFFIDTCFVRDATETCVKANFDFTEESSSVLTSRSSFAIPIDSSSSSLREDK